MTGPTVTGSSATTQALLAGEVGLTLAFRVSGANGYPKGGVTGDGLADFPVIPGIAALSAADLVL